jgi:hypothetical protein
MHFLKPTDETNDIKTRETRVPVMEEEDEDRLRGASQNVVRLQLLNRDTWPAFPRARFS